MSFGIDAKKLKTLVDLYHPQNSGQELKYMIHLKGEEELFRNLQTCPFQGISTNSIQDRELAFGKNKLQARDISTSKILINSLNEHYIYLPITLSIMLIIYRYFSATSKDRNIQQCIFLLGITILNWILKAIQQLYLKYKWSKTDIEMNEQICTVVRENKKQEISSLQLTAGDVVQFKEGVVIPADGWLLQGVDVRVVEHYLSEYVQVQKDTLRKCITDIKGALQKNGQINEKTIQLDRIKSYKSPVLVSGSTVKSGQGRMIVLCVGKNSRKGQFLALSRQKPKENIVKLKISKLMKTLCSSLLVLSISYVAIFILQTILKALSKNSLSYLLQMRAWINIELFIIVIAIGIPQGIQLAILGSLTFIKARLWFNQQIWVNYCEDMMKMAAVTEICYDREKSWDRIQYLEWWNEQRVLFEKKNQEKQQFQKEYTQQSEQNQLQSIDSNEYFKLIMKIGLQFKYSQLSQYQSLSNVTTKIENKINNWQFFQQNFASKCFKYICDKKELKYVTMSHYNQKDNCQFIFVKAQAHRILQICSKMLVKSTGEIRAFDKKFLKQIEDAIKSMNKTMKQTYAIAYCICQDGQIKSQIESIEQKQMTLLCLLGVGNRKDYTDYEILRKLKETGVKLILASSKPISQSINRSKDIGINTLQEDNLTMEGEDLMKIIGGIICFKCKKSFCLCQKIEYYNPKIKNLQQFRRITQYFKVMANATYYHKYSLIIAYHNIGKNIAYMGIQSEDNPAQTNSYLSITSTISNANLGNSQVYFPNNSLKCLYNFIIWSRFSSQVISKIIQLTLPTNLVSIIIAIFGAIIFQTIPFSIMQILWISVVITFMTSLNLSWQQPKEVLMEASSRSFDKESCLLGQQVRKQITFQCIFQSVLLLLLLAFGHQFLPEQSDKVDDIIGSNWQAKYSSVSMDKVASGLYKNDLLPTYSYEQTFNIYGIYSRHLTIVFNTFALMQIFNYFNCRKIGAKQINILQGIQLHNIFLFVIILIAHFLFIGFASDYASLYPANLTIKQWLISIGLALLVEMLAFVVRLLPDSSKERSSKRGWPNKSYNLSIKLVGKSDRFYQFDREEDILFKNR